jgi:cytochrome c553
MRARVAIIIAVGLAACRSQSEPPSLPERPPAHGSKKRLGPIEAVERATTVQMPSHFADVFAVHDALVEGALPRAHAAATHLLGEQPDTMLADWAPHLFAVRAAAGRVAEAQDLERAAVASAELATTCADCHLALGAHPRPEVAELPPLDGEAAAQMQRHAWAFERLWEGLVLPSDDSWRRGCDAFVELPTCDDGPSSDRDPAAIQRAREQTAALELEARAAATPEARAAVYARMLPTCSACHAAGC